MTVKFNYVCDICETATDKVYGLSRDKPKKLVMAPEAFKHICPTCLSALAGCWNSKSMKDRARSWDKDEEPDQS